MSKRLRVVVLRVSSFVSAAAPLVLLTVSCTGQVPKDGAAQGGEGGDDGGNGGGSELPAGLDPKTDDQLICNEPKVTVTPLRRLTNAEYDDTVADLLSGLPVGKPSQTLRFPADAYKGNFSNDASKQEIVSALAEAYFNAAQQLSATATASLEKLMGCDPSVAANEDSCVGSFIASFGTRAFRRPLSVEERDRFTAFYKAERANNSTASAMASLLQRFLMAPQFLYRIESGTVATRTKAQKLDGWQMASRLSYLLTGTMPDADLFAAAKNGKLDTPDAVATQATRLLAGPKASAIVRRFFREWLDLGMVTGIQRDDAVHPGFTPALTTFLLEQAERFTEDLVLSGERDYRDLFRSKRLFTNKTLAAFYKTEGPNSDSFAEMQGDLTKTFGILSNSAVMAVTSHGDDRKQAIFRGKWLRNRLLCQELPVPPAGIPGLPAVDKSLSNRKQLQAHVADPSCNSCHRLLDTAGFAFENLDTVGRWRTEDGGLAVDSSAELVDAADASGTMEGVAGLSEKLADSLLVQSCVSRELFRFSAGRQEGDADACSLRDLRHKLRDTGSFKEAILAFVRSDAFRFAAIAD